MCNFIYMKRSEFSKTRISDSLFMLSNATCAIYYNFAMFLSLANILSVTGDIQASLTTCFAYQLNKPLTYAYKFYYLLFAHTSESNPTIDPH